MGEEQSGTIDFRALAETVSAAIWVFQGERVRYVNSGAERISGYSRDELLGMQFWDIVHPDYVELIRERGFARQSGAPVPLRYEFKFITKSGEERWLDMSATLIEFDGKPAGLGTGFDITERKRAEEELLKSEARRAALLNAVPDLMFHMKADGTFIGFQAPEGAAVYVQPSDFLGRGVQDVMPEAIANDALRLIAETLSSGRAQVFEYQLLMRGDVRDYEARLVSCGADEVLAIVRDITERRQAEIVLRESEARLRSVFEHSRDGIGVIRAGVHEYVNSAYSQMFGCSEPEKFMGQSCSDLLVREPDFTEHSQAYETRGRRKDGGEFDVDVRVSTYVFAGERRSILAIRDISLQKRLEEQARKAQMMDAVGRLAGGVAHDFNNLLTIIKGYAQLTLNELPPDDPLVAKLEYIAHASKRAETLADQLLTFSQRQVVQPRVIDLNRALTEAYRPLRRLLDESIELRIVPAEKLHAIRIDPRQLQRVLINLATNASEAMPHGGILTIEAHNVAAETAATASLPSVEHVMLAVSDTGGGMDAITLSHLFEPFFTTKESPQRKGLGLPATYGIIRQSGGEIRAASEPGKGTTFQIYLPAAPDEMPEPVLSRQPESGMVDGKTVLVVEDEPAVRELARQVLVRYGCRVLSAADAQEALSLAKKGTELIDVLLTDVVMPNMSGRELAVRLREQRPDLKVVYMSGYPRDILAMDLGNAEFTFLQKPFSPSALAAKIREALQQA